MNYPKIYILGAPKCGTTAIRNYLHKHKIVDFSLEEPGYYDAKFRYGPERTNPYSTSGDYLNLFNDEGKIYGDGSVYMMYDIDIIKEILKNRPDAKFLIFVRDPIEASISMHGENLKPRKIGREPFENFQDAWKFRTENEEQFISGIASHRFKYHELYRYSKYIPPIEKLLGNKLKVFNYKDFKKDNKKILDEVCSFLEVSHIKDFEEEQINQRSSYRDNFISNLIFTIAEIANKYNLLNSLRGKGLTNNFLTQKKLEKPSINKEFKLFLEHFFKDDYMYLKKKFNIKF